METKHHATKKPIGQWRNETGNQKIQGKLKWKYNFPKSMGCSKRSYKREVYSDISPPQETRKISNQQPNLPSKRIRKRRTNKTQS